MSLRIVLDILTGIGALTITLGTVVGAVYAYRTLVLERKKKLEAPVTGTVSEKPRILIVDDNAQFVRMFQATLNGDYAVEGCTSCFAGAHLLIEARKFEAKFLRTDARFAVAFIDYNMPGEVSAKQMIGMIRVWQPFAKIVLVSGGMVGHDVRKLADDFWEKPFLFNVKEKMRELICA